MKLEVSDLSYQYASGAGIEEVSFVAEGLVGVVGRNGAGKTTLFSCLTGQLLPRSGSLNVDGAPCAFRDLDCGFAPSFDYFLPRLTGRQNLEYQSHLKTGRSDAWKPWSPWLEELELTEHLDKSFREYSTGMRKKIQLIPSLLDQPALVLWDEPHNGVDLVSNAVLGRLLKHLVNSGTTVLLSSHVGELLTSVCSSLAVLRKGRMGPVVVPPYPSELVSLL